MFDEILQLITPTQVMEKVRNENMFWKGKEITRINVMHFPLMVFRGDDYDGTSDGRGDRGEDVEGGDVGGDGCNMDPHTERDLHLMREPIYGMLMREEDNRCFKCFDKFTTQEEHESNPMKSCDTGGSRCCHSCHNEWAQGFTKNTIVCMRDECKNLHTCQSS
jgi:hypothetical protein